MLDIIEIKGQSFVPTYVGIDMLKKEGGIDQFLLGDGCKNVEKVCKKSDENGQK